MVTPHTSERGLEAALKGHPLAPAHVRSVTAHLQESARAGDAVEGSLGQRTNAEGPPRLGGIGGDLKEVRSSTAGLDPHPRNFHMGEQFLRCRYRR